MFKNIKTLEEFRKIPIKERYKYNIDNSLLRTVKVYKKQKEPLESLEEGPFLVEPFWEGMPIIFEDKELNYLINLETVAMKEYLKKKPDFKVLVRKNVKVRLMEAQNIFPINIKLVIKIGLRPLSVQKDLYYKIREYIAKKYPVKNGKEIDAITECYISNPSKDIPPHSTGGAVDCCLFDVTRNEYLDMGSALNFPGEASWTGNFKGLNSKQISNRLLFVETMTKVGFANLASEWWHYSYGDRCWALYYGKKEALYNTVDFMD